MSKYRRREGKQGQGSIGQRKKYRLQGLKELRTATYNINYFGMIKSSPYFWYYEAVHYLVYGQQIKKMLMIACESKVISMKI